MTDHPNLAAALAAVQAELPRVGKGNTAKVTSDKGNYSYKFADLADVSAEILPVLGKHGLSFSAKPTVDDSGKFVLAYVLRHASGDEDSGTYPLPANGSPQQIGSAITYGRRYTLCAMTGIAPDADDDGQAATAHVEAETEEDKRLNADAFSDEIRTAKTGDELSETAKNIRRSLRTKKITEAAYDRLTKEGSARRAELDTEAKRIADEARAAVEEVQNDDATHPV